MKLKTILLLSFSLLLPLQVIAQNGNLQRSEKKTLFVFPVDFNGRTMEVPKGDISWAEKEFIDLYVNTFERFDYVEMPNADDFQEFLADSKTYIEEHAREIVQKRKTPDGRIREARVNLDDLKKAVKNGYIFRPRVTKVDKHVKKVKDQDDEIYFDVNARIDIYRTFTGEKITRIIGSSDDPSAMIGQFKAMAMGRFISSGSEKERASSIFKNTLSGVYEQMKVDVRKMDEFQLKAVAYDTGMNGFSIGLGADFGVRKDRRYKAWSLNSEGKKDKMLAFGKARKIEENKSRIQILIGSVGAGDQVLEDARFGLNIGPHVMGIPWKAEGFDEMGILFNTIDPNIVFDMPPDEEGGKLNIGLQLEYNIAWITNVSELYIIAEGGWIPVEDMMAWNGMLGLRKKAYFRRVGLFGTVKVGAIGLEFLDTDIFDDPDVEEGDDATVIGAGVDIGAEILITPNWTFKGQVGFYGFPKQTVLSGWDTSDGEWKSAQITSAGVTIGFGLTYTL